MASSYPAQCGSSARIKQAAMRFLIAILALAGVVVSALALQVHYATGTEPCSINEKWDCGIVNHSPFAEIEHIPVAAIGIAGYLVLAGLALARRRCLLARRCTRRPGIRALSQPHREGHPHGLVPLLRHLAGHHRADHAAQPGLAGRASSSAKLRGRKAGLSPEHRAFLASAHLR